MERLLVHEADEVDMLPGMFGTNEVCTLVEEPGDKLSIPTHLMDFAPDIITTQGDVNTVVDKKRVLEKCLEVLKIQTVSSKSVDVCEQILLGSRASRSNP